MEFIALLVLFAVLSRVLEAVGGKKGKQRQPPPRDPGGVRRPVPRPRPAQDAPSGTGTAADMLPDELWEMLTGQKRPRAQVPAPAERAPVPVLDDEVEEPRRVSDEEADAEAYIASHQRDVQGEIDETLRERRNAALRRLDEVVVPAERVPPSDRVRHRQFHEKIDRKPVPAPRARSIASGLGLERPADLRRAFILSEVLGRPKALESDDPDR